MLDAYERMTMHGAFPRRTNGNCQLHECASLFVQRSCGPGGFTERLDGLHNGWEILLEILIPCR
jgi:hypothetical protein